MSAKKPICLFFSSTRSFSRTGWTGVKVTESRCSTKANRFKLVVVGGGSGGCSVAAKFAKKISPNSIAVIEPADTHYYQPMWTLVGGGLKSLEDSAKPMSAVLPKGIEWIKESAVNFNPKSNTVRVSSGQEIEYDFLIVSIGIQLYYDKVKGLQEALEFPGVCSNYSPKYVNKTFQALQSFQKGNAVFTFPNTPVKCAGAPQKIVYLTEDYLKRTNKKKDAKIIYCTSLGVLFGIKKYADVLWDVVKGRGIDVKLRHNLVEVLPKEKKAIFQNLDKPEETTCIEYEMLHVTPPMGPHEVMRNSTDNFCDASGFLNIDKDTLQHINYPNVFGLGDCTNLPTAKTAAAVAAQNGIVADNLWAVMNNKKPTRVYDGYTSCPLVTSDHTCILAEFDYTGQPLETFPFNQAKERRSMFYLKRDAMPFLYWNLMMNGLWNGPGIFRKLLKFSSK